MSTAVASRYDLSPLPRPPRLVRRVRRVAALFLLAGLTLLTSAGPAAAHNVLIGSDPADGASLTTGPARVSLTFDVSVRPGFTTVTVTGPDGNQWQAGPPVEDGATVSAPLQALGPAGEYTIGYQVLSEDSHTVQGAVRFVLTTPGPRVATPPETAENTTSSSSSGSSTGGIPAWPFLAGAGALLAAGVVVALRIGRAR
ncbi:MAG: copper resistance CopC family protein [Pseudonocardiaceae bacterium]